MIANKAVIRRSGISGYADAAYPNRRNSFLGDKLLFASLIPLVCTLIKQNYTTYRLSLDSVFCVGIGASNF